MKRSHYIIGGLALAISMPSCLQAQTTQPKDTTMTRTVVVEQEYNPDKKFNPVLPRDMYVPDMVIMAIWIFLPIIYSVCRRKTN